jgi:hypothetical protein
MSICATVGRPVITQIDVCIHDGFVVFDNPQADQLFLYYVLKWVEPDWSKHGQTGSQMNLNTGLINGTPIHLPPLPEQTAIATVLSDMDKELAALEQRRDKTTRTSSRSSSTRRGPARSKSIPPNSTTAPAARRQTSSCRTASRKAASVSTRHWKPWSCSAPRWPRQPCSQTVSWHSSNTSAATWK